MGGAEIQKGSEVPKKHEIIVLQCVNHPVFSFWLFPNRIMGGDREAHDQGSKDRKYGRRQYLHVEG